MCGVSAPNPTTPQTQCNLLHRFREIGHKPTPKENSLYSTAVRGEPEHTDKQAKRPFKIEYVNVNFESKCSIYVQHNLLTLFNCSPRLLLLLFRTFWNCSRVVTIHISYFV